MDLKVGLLVILGMSAIVTVILMSDSVSFKEPYTITAYLANAGGLREGSPVKSNGLPIGQVGSINASTDSRGAIAIVLSIDTEHRVYRSSELKVITQGIFGDSYLEFSGEQKGDTAYLPNDNSASVIAVPGLLDEMSKQGKDIISGIADLLNDDMRADIKRMVKNSADVTEESVALMRLAGTAIGNFDKVLIEAEQLAKEMRTAGAGLSTDVNRSLTHIDGLVGELRAHMDALSKDLQGAVEQSDKSMQSLGALADSSQQTLVDNKEHLQAIMTDMRTAVHEFAIFTEAMNSSSGVVGQLLHSQELAKDMNDAMINISDVSERVADNPEVLVWGQTDAEAAAAIKARERLRLRRAFNQGYTGVMDTTAIQPVKQEVSSTVEESE